MYILQNVTTVRLVNTHYLTVIIFFPCDENFKIYSLSIFQIYIIANYSHHAACILPGPSYLITGSLYLLTTFI